MNEKAREAWMNIYYLVVKLYDKYNEMNGSKKMKL